MSAVQKGISRKILCFGRGFFVSEQGNFAQQKKQFRRFPVPGKACRKRPLDLDGLGLRQPLPEACNRGAGRSLTSSFGKGSFLRTDPENFLTSALKIAP
jgi:hypothetical protein